MKPSEITQYLSNLATDFELQGRDTEAIYLREAAALVASHVGSQLTRCTMTLGDQVFDMMSQPEKPVLTTWQRKAEQWRQIAQQFYEGHCEFGEYGDDDKLCGAARNYEKATTDERL